MYVDSSGNLYFSDPESGTVKIMSSKMISVSSDCSRSLIIDTSAKADAQYTIIARDLNNPRGIFIGSDGLLYIADTGNNKILKQNSADTFEFAETRFEGSVSPYSVWVSTKGTIYVAGKTAILI